MHLYHRITFCLIFCLEIVSSINLSSLDKLDLSALDYGNFNGLFIQDMDNDEKLEILKNLAMKLPLLTKDPKICTFPVLEVSNLEKIQSLSIPSKDTSYLKDPCLTLIMIFDDYQDLEMLAKTVQIPGQPYFFAIKLQEDLEVFEVQTYSRKVVPVNSQNVLERRSDFNGAPIRMTIHKDDKFWMFMEHIQKSMNFTTEEVNFEGFGNLLNGSWSGSIKQLMENEIDIAPLALTIIKERLQVVDAGFGFDQTRIEFFFSRTSSESISWWAWITVFEAKSWILIGISFVVLSLILSVSFERKMNLRSFTWSIVAVTKAYLAQSVDTNFMKKQKPSKHLMIWSISFLGGFLFWYFIGVLISLMTVPSKIQSIESLDDLHKMKNFKLATYGNGFIATYTDNWAKKNKKNEDIHRKFIAPYVLQSIDHETMNEAIKRLLENNSPQEAFLTTTSLFDRTLNKGI